MLTWRCACLHKLLVLKETGMHHRPQVTYCRNSRTCCSQTSDTSSRAGPSKAAALIIGNEILSGSITDTNTPWLAQLLYKQGIDLVRAEYIPDDISDIRQTVLRLKERVGSDGFIFSSGGIGPTHDDVTYEALASAFGVQLKVHEPTVKLMQEHYAKSGKEVNAARLRMATLPQGAEVLVTEGLWVPLVNLQNVYILPGIPRLFQGMINAHRDRFLGGKAFHTLAVYTSVGEGDLASIFGELAQQFPDVRMGSYPNVNAHDKRFTAKLQLESRDARQLQSVMAAVKDKIPTHDLAD
ncbi:hypothetical protein ABBQ32_011845 [Trebouxia sp. C0010 RCD-2024]